MKWKSWLAWEIPALMLTAGALRYYRVPAPIPPANLNVFMTEPHKGQVLIHWNRAAKPVLNASLGSIELADGVTRQTISLTPALLAQGSFSYLRSTDDVAVRFTVVDSSGYQYKEDSRLLGQPLVSAEDPAKFMEIQNGKNRLESDIEALRAQNAAQAARLHQLNRSLQTLETKLGIDTPSRP